MDHLNSTSLPQIQWFWMVLTNRTNCKLENGKASGKFSWKCVDVQLKSKKKKNGNCKHGKLETRIDENVHQKQINPYKRREKKWFVLYLMVCYYHLDWAKDYIWNWILNRSIWYFKNDYLQWISNIFWMQQWNNESIPPHTYTHSFHLHTNANILQ